MLFPFSLFQEFVLPRSLVCSMMPIELAVHAQLLFGHMYKQNINLYRSIEDR